VYAVISDRTRQFTVRKGDTILCDLDAQAAPGASVTFDTVLMVGGEGSARVGSPTVAGASVKGVVLGTAKGPKLVAFRFHRRKNVRVKRGHRSHFTRVEIQDILA
jgi:large subunit ribosomal protein L21